MSIAFICSSKLVGKQQNVRVTVLGFGSCRALSYSPQSQHSFNGARWISLTSSRNGSLRLSDAANRTRLPVGAIPARVMAGSQCRSFWWKSSAAAAPSKDDAVSETVTSATSTTKTEPIQATEATEAASATTSTADASSIPPSPVVSESTASASEITDAALESAADTSTSLLSASLPLQYGDLASLGLISYTPAGLIRWSLELIQVTTALPWFHTIVIGSLLWRLLLTPFVIQNLQNTARLQPLQPKLLELRDEMKRASESGDRLAMQRCALKQKKIYGDAGVSMGKMMITPFVQLPVTLGLFFGVRKMCNLPVEQLKDSGVSWLPDLTVPDPYGVLPWILMVVVNIQISAGAREMNLKERPEMGHLMNALRILTLGGVWVMTDFPSGLMVSLLVTSTATTAQTLLLQSPTVRRYFDIPVVPKEHKGRLPSYRESVNYLIDTYRKKVEEARKAHQQDMMRRRR